ncbi:protein of unknown function [Pararobbsia alpina]
MIGCACDPQRARRGMPSRAIAKTPVTHHLGAWVRYTEVIATSLRHRYDAIGIPGFVSGSCV